MRSRLSSLLYLSALAVTAAADPTWPNAIDDLEEIMYQIFDFRARKFADLVHPCDNQGSGAGRQNAAEWLRTGFHDMYTANTFFGTGGLDGSLQYELTNGENAGPGFGRTLSFMAPYFSKKTSVADLIALGVYTSVRACDGPVIPVRHGRVDATRKGSTGVPQVGNSVLTFKQQFSRMGFDEFEMIQLVACGHSLGGVHSTEFPALVPSGQFPNDRAPLDSTPASYDNHIVTEYLDDSTDNPLIKGPSVGLGHNSDFKVFSSDGNATMQAMADNNVFQSTCQNVLGRMIDVVPNNVVLTNPVQPYMVKPVNLQLLLNAGGATTLQWTGYIRVRTTELPLADIQSLTITYKDRNGGSNCGSSTCSRTLTVSGIGRGFDDSFAVGFSIHSLDIIVEANEKPLSSSSPSTRQSPPPAASPPSPSPSTRKTATNFPSITTETPTPCKMPSSSRSSKPVSSRPPALSRLPPPCATTLPTRLSARRLRTRRRAIRALCHCCRR